MKPPDGLAGLAAREAGHLEEPSPADARLLALANRALAERVAELEAQMEGLVADTEALIVAWLRFKRLQTQDYSGDDNAVSWTLHATANRIERGEHRREGEP